MSSFYETVHELYSVKYTTQNATIFLFQDEWNSEKDQALLKLEELHCGNWEIIAKNISGNYSHGQLENKCKDLQEQNIEIVEHKIKVEEGFSENDETLIEIERLFPENWDIVSKNLDENESPKDVRARFMKLHNLISEVFFAEFQLVDVF